MLKETSRVSGGDCIERLTHSLHQRFPAPGLRLTHKAFDLRESLPTFICVVQTHILDDARGAEDGLRRMLAARWLSRNSPSTPMETPTANRDRRGEVASSEPSAGRSKGGVVNERGGGGRGQSLRAGIDVGKEFHWAHVLDASGRELRGASYFPESSKMMNQTSPTS